LISYYLKKIFLLIGFYYAAGYSPGFSQAPPVDRMAFINDSSIGKATLITHLDKLLKSHRKGSGAIHGNFIIVLSDGRNVNERILIEPTGDFRLEYCLIPPVKLKFNYDGNVILAPLKSLKMISACRASPDFNQYLFKEYLIYRIYNVLTDKSLRVRLLSLEIRDSTDVKKSISVYAYLMENITDIANRNQCHVWKSGKLHSELADRRNMTMVSIFEYMIGNTDWAVATGHNVKLIVSKMDSLKRPFVIPFDFDFSGLVNAHYAIPDERLHFRSVRERRYLGYPRNMTEFEEVLSTYRLQKKNIYALIRHFDLLSLKNREEMISYLDEFFEMINQPQEVKLNFITNAVAQ
jgi:hypothetical protein